MADHMTAETLRKQLVRIEVYARTRCLADDAGNKPDPNSALVHIANTLSQLASRLSGMAADTWQPIETAPKDGLVTELQYTGGQVTRGHWVPQFRMWNCYGVFRDPAEFTTWFRIPEPPHV